MVSLDKQFFNQMFRGSWITQGLSMAAELEIADLLADVPSTIEYLAEQTHTHSGCLHRLLRALASVGIFTQDELGRFSLTPLAKFLQNDVPDSQRPFAIMMGSEFQAAWGELLYSLRTGEPGFEKRFGIPFFQYMMEHPDRHSFYDQAMGTFGRDETGPVLEAYPFGTFRTVVDLGGGRGVGGFLSETGGRIPAVWNVANSQRLTIPANAFRGDLDDEPRRVLEELARIRVVDVVLPTKSGHTIRRRCVSQPTDHQAILLQRLGLHLLKNLPLSGQF